MMRSVYDFGTALQLKQVQEEQWANSKSLEVLGAMQNGNQSRQNKARLAARALLMRHPKRTRIFPWIELLFPSHPSLSTLGSRVAGWWADFKLNMQLAHLVGVDLIADMMMTEPTERKPPPHDWKLPFLTCHPDLLRVISENGEIEDTSRIMFQTCLLLSNIHVCASLGAPDIEVSCVSCLIWFYILYIVLLSALANMPTSQYPGDYVALKPEQVTRVFMYARDAAA